MEIRPFSQIRDYARVAGWWESAGFEPLAPDALPQYGFVVNDICAGWLYRTDSSMAVIEWIVADPESDKEQRSQALDALLDKLLETARGVGITRIFTSANHPRLIERYERHGGVAAESNMTNVWWRLEKAPKETR